VIRVAAQVVNGEATAYVRKAGRRD